MPIFDEMEKQKALSFIMSRHEQGAVFMAQGISRASLSTAHPRTGVCMATSGPGAMNLVTGIADANMDSVPLLAITGQVPTGVIATDAFQESEVVGVMMPLTKQTYMPLSVDEIEATGGAGAMGCALPMSIGVKLARPEERVWSVSGDGGGQMNMQELGTIMEHGIDVKILLWNLYVTPARSFCPWCRPAAVWVI
jgi:thiamine pyrophosphate-dependent acetolactate synthase large subunit-like protein